VAAALAVLVAGGLASAGTSSSTIPASTANARDVRITGAAMKGVGYSVLAGTVTTITVQIKGPRVVGLTTLFTTVTARFGSGLAVPCVVGLYDAVTDTTPATCTGIAESATRPRALTITVT
jgi:hypothetical protein